MKILGFSLNKLYIERMSHDMSNLKINTKIDISDISETKSSFLKLKEEVIGVRFTYEINYDPDYAKIELSGSVLVAVEPKLAREIIRQWEDKKMPEEFRVDIFNIIIKKSTIKALELEDEMNLPSHIPFPVIGKSSGPQDSSK